MSLPDGVTTCLLTYGPITDTFGNLADSITVEVVADRTIVHAASGRTMFKHPVSVTAEGGGVAQLPVPHTDQAGFRDQQQNSLTGWYYTVTLTARFPGGGIESDRKTFQPLVGQVTRDADLLSSPGMVTPGVTVDGTAVTSVIGLTGEVTEADLAATFASLNDDGELVVDGVVIETGGGGSTSVTEVAASGTTETIPVPAAGAVVDLTLTADCTVAFSGATDGKMCQTTIFLRQDATGSREVTWPATVLWATGVAPGLSFTPGYVDILTVFTIDGGATYFGALNGSSFQPPGLPAAPTGLNVTAGDETCSLSWSAVIGASPAVTGYKVYRGTASGALTLLVTLGNVTSYEDTAVVNDTTYFYKVAAVSAVGTGTQSTEDSATPADASGLPVTTPAPTQWFKADAISGLSDGAAVSSWVDSSVSNLPATQATGGNRPTYKVSIANGLPVVRFDGTTDYLGSTYTMPTDHVTVFAVLRPAVAGAGQMILSTANTGVALQINSAGKLELDRQASAMLVTSTVSVSTSQFGVVMAQVNDVSPFDQVGLDGVAVAGSGRSPIVVAGNPTIGALNSGGTYNTFFNGDIAEFILFPGVLSPTDITAVKTYLASKYGIAVS